MSASPLALLYFALLSLVLPSLVPPRPYNRLPPLAFLVLATKTSALSELTSVAKPTAFSGSTLAKI